MVCCCPLSSVIWWTLEHCFINISSIQTVETDASQRTNCLPRTLSHAWPERLMHWYMLAGITKGRYETFYMVKLESGTWRQKWRSTRDDWNLDIWKTEDEAEQLWTHDSNTPSEVIQRKEHLCAGVTCPHIVGRLMTARGHLLHELAVDRSLQMNTGDNKDNTSLWFNAVQMDCRQKMCRVPSILKRLR